jgi:hypothetical protein
MKSLFRLAGVLTIVALPVLAQDGGAAIGSREDFLETIALEVTLADVSMAVEDMDALEALASRVLLLDGVASSITVYSTDPADYYVELELVGGAWSGLEAIEVYSAYIVFDHSGFENRFAERVPRDPPPELILRNDRVLIAGRLVSIAETPTGDLVPVLQAYDIRPLR